MYGVHGCEICGVHAREYADNSTQTCSLLTDSHAGVWGLQRLEQVLASERAFEPRFRHAPFLAQFSSLGSLDAAWVEDEFKGAACAGRCQPCEPGSKPQAMQRPTEFTQLVWPTVAEVQNSIEGWLAGRSIPGPHKNVSKPFLAKHWHRHAWGWEVFVCCVGACVQVCR